MSEEAQDQTQEESKGKKPIVLIAALLVVEAAVIMGAMMMFGPKDTSADEQVDVVGVPEDQKIVEVQILDGRLSNAKTGVEMIYKTEIYMQVKMKYQEQVQSELDQFQNELRAELSAIWRTSEPHHFKEPRYENLTRKVDALLKERFGNDPESGDSIVEKTVIVMGSGFRVDM